MRCLKCLKCLNFMDFIFNNIPRFTHRIDLQNKVCTAPKVKTVKAPLQSSYNEVVRLSHRRTSMEYDDTILALNLTE